jgi:hypothetical protein
MRFFIHIHEKNELMVILERRISASYKIDYLVPTFEKHMWYSRHIEEEGISSIIKLTYLTFIGIILLFFKGKWKSHHPPSQEIKSKSFI